MIIEEDMKYIKSKLSQKEIEKLKNAEILITGCAGFLGYYFMNFFLKHYKEFEIKKIIAVDNFIVGKPLWIDKFKNEKNIEIVIQEFDIAKDDIGSLYGVESINMIIHMASIASPIFYRKYPIETLDANIWGLRKLLDYYRDKQIKGFLFFSSSEVYGDPTIENIPTKEEYNGNVSQLGSRSCYDEAKRFGETICYLYSKQYNMPVSLVRPFNNYGPGMKLFDQRVPADFAKCALEGKDIEIFSDGTPTRTFCYVADAVAGYLKVLLLGEFDVFNIGISKPEISVKELADIYVKKAKEIFGSDIRVTLKVHSDKEYLQNNPNRRCPVIDKATEKLGYDPEIEINEGVERFLRFLDESTKEGVKW